MQSTNICSAPHYFRLPGVLAPGWSSLTYRQWALSLLRFRTGSAERKPRPYHFHLSAIGPRPPRRHWLLGSGCGWGWSRLRKRRLLRKVFSGRAGGGDVRSCGRQGPPAAPGTLYLWARESRHKSATEPWRRWPRRRRRQRRRQLWGLRLGVCRPPLLLGPGMYKWLVRILGTIFRFCDRSVPPARALLKRRRSNR